MFVRIQLPRSQNLHFPVGPKAVLGPDVSASEVKIRTRLSSWSISENIFKVLVILITGAHPSINGYPQ